MNLFVPEMRMMPLLVLIWVTGESLNVINSLQEPAGCAIGKSELVQIQQDIIASSNNGS